MVAVLVGTVMLLALVSGFGGKVEPAGAQEAQPAPVCKTLPGYFTYKNQFGQKLAHFYMSQKACWDGSRITYLGAPVVRVGITQLGANNGWRYNGIAARRDYFYEYKDLPRGAHVTSRKYSFVVCPPSGSCYEKRPVIQIRAFFDKTGYARAWG